MLGVIKGENLFEAVYQAVGGRLCVSPKLNSNNKAIIPKETTLQYSPWATVSRGVHNKRNRITKYRLCPHSISMELPYFC